MTSFFLVDLSSPCLVDLLDEQVTQSNQPIAGVEAKLGAADLDRLPVQRGLAVIERSGLPLYIADAELATLVKSRFPNLTITT